MEIAITVSVVAHAFLLIWVVWELATVMSRGILAPDKMEPVEEVTLVYPELLMPEPPPPVPEPPKPEAKPYVRTTQSSGADEAPKQADFVSDRNTVAASEMEADPNGKPNMPTQDGIDPLRMELANRDFKDGEIREDGATPVPNSPASPAPGSVASMLKSQPVSPPPAPEPPPPPPPVEVAKAIPVTPLEAMMREQDEGEAARLSLEPGTKPKTEPVTVPEMRAAPETPPDTPPEPVKPQVNPADAPGGAATPDPVKQTAGPLDKDAFSPYTRTSKVRGTISNRGEAAVNAAETPVGRYMRQVTGAVEKKWHVLRRKNADAVTFGNLRLRFYVKANGEVDPPTILSKRSEADPRMVDFTLQAILEADIPPIPPDLLPLLEGQRLEVEYDVLIY